MFFLYYNMRNPPLEQILPLEQFLRHLGHKVLQIERNKVSHILELAFHEALLCQRSHVLRQRFDALHESGIRMIDDLHTFLGSISEEIDSSTVEILLVGFSIHDISLA